MSRIDQVLDNTVSVIANTSNHSGSSTLIEDVSVTNMEPSEIGR